MINNPPLKQLFTLYGRKPTLEALEDNSLKIFRLHLADSNQSGGIMQSITHLAKQRNIDIQTHNKKELSRISKNGKQDQGVALDIIMPNFMDANTFFDQKNHTGTFIALDNITNPQNLGMIIRSVCASKIQALIIPIKGCARLDALVIKASVGTLFKCPIIRCHNLAETLEKLRQQNQKIITLKANGRHSLFDTQLSSSNTTSTSSVFVIGNETEGVSSQVEAIATDSVFIPMENGVESLNAAVTASLVAFFSTL